MIAPSIRAVCRPSLRFAAPRRWLPAVMLSAACVSAPAAKSTTAASNTATSSAEGPRPAAQPPDLRTPKNLPDQAREMLTARMMRHGDEMTALTSAVLMLEYDLTHTLASELSEEPKLGRPAPGEAGTLNALLPAEFFAQQDALTDSAKRLARAAQRRDDAQIVASFGDVTKSCVGCHSAYLNAAVDGPARAADDGTAPCNPEEACGANEGR